jgi:anti-sigma factor RsiW
LESPGELACKELVEIVTDYLEDRLTTQDRMRFEQHLAICEGCSAYLEQMRQTIQIAGTLREDSIPHDIRERLLDAFRDWKAVRSERE